MDVKIRYLINKGLKKKDISKILEISIYRLNLYIKNFDITYMKKNDINSDNLKYKRIFNPIRDMMDDLFIDPVDYTWNLYENL